MKVVHLVTYDCFGAGRAAERISSALNSVGCDSKVLTLGKSLNSEAISMTQTAKSLFKLKIFNRLNYQYNKKHVKNGYFHFDYHGQSYSDVEWIKKADIINLHWVNEGIWSKKFVKEMSKLNKPIVWTLHDMWTFTGGCHYDRFCGKYVEGCRECTFLQGRGDVALLASETKCRQIKELNIQMVGCSRWITGEYNKSYIGKSSNSKCLTIPNPISNKSFHIMDKMNCRELLNLPKDKKLIAFGAVASTSDERKGFKYLREALKSLNPNEYELVVFGCTSYNEIKEFKVHCVGNINDDIHLAMIYNSSDCFVAPSLQENLANTVVEALSCGVPVVAFDIGGMSDLIQHKKSGYLAKAYNSVELLNGIKFCINNSVIMSRNAIDFTEKFLNEKRVGTMYCDLYNHLIKK